MKQLRHLAIFLIVLLVKVSLCSSAYNLKELSGFKCPGITKINTAIRVTRKIKSNVSA